MPDLITSSPNGAAGGVGGLSALDGVNIDAMDPADLVMLCMKEGYLVAADEARELAKRVRHANAQARAKREHLSAMREAAAKAQTQHRNEHIDPSSPDLTPQQQARSNQIMADLAKEYGNDTLSRVLNAAVTKGAGAIADDFGKFLQERFGVDVPPALRAEMERLIGTGKQEDVAQAVELAAQFTAFLGDMGTQNGAYGAAGCADFDGMTVRAAEGQTGTNARNQPVYQITKPEELFADFQSYLQTPNANGDLAAADIEGLDAAFLSQEARDQGLTLGLTGASSIHDVTAAALSPVTDEWRNEMFYNANASSQEVNDLMRSGKFDDPAVTAMFGSEEAAKNAFLGQYGNDPASQLRAQAGIPAQGFPPGVSTPEELDAHIKRQEEELNSMGEDRQMLNIDLQNALQKMQMCIQFCSNVLSISKEMSMGIIRNIGK